MENKASRRIEKWIESLGKWLGEGWNWINIHSGARSGSESDGDGATKSISDARPMAGEQTCNLSEWRSLSPAIIIYAYAQNKLERRGGGGGDRSTLDSMNEYQYLISNN